MAWNVWSLTSNRWMLITSVRSRDAAFGAIESFLKKDYPDEDLEPRRVRPLLEQHGTTLMKLKPSMIWGLAMADLEKRERNKAGDRNSPEHYSFHRSHVRKAKTANDVIRAAIEAPALGRASDKSVTRLLYADEELLRQSLR